MKLFKMFFSSLLILAAVHCGFAHADQADTDNLPVYKVHIKDIKLNYSGRMLSGPIFLDNGVVVLAVDYNNRDDVTLNNWRRGDAVELSAHVKDNLYITLKRMDVENEALEVIGIYDTAHPPKDGLVIIEITDNGHFIKLSDGSVWQFGVWNRLNTKHWNLGDHVIVEGLGLKNSYKFINLSAPLSANVTTATASFVAH